MRVSTYNLVFPALIVISRMNSFCETEAYPPLRYRAMGPSLVPVDKQRPVRTMGMLSASEIDAQSMDRAH